MQAPGGLNSFLFLQYKLLNKSIKAYQKFGSNFQIKKFIFGCQLKGFLWNLNLKIPFRGKLNGVGLVDN